MTIAMHAPNSGTDLGTIAFGDARNDRFLRREVAIQVAGAHPGFGANLLHRRLVKARASKTSPCRIEDFLPAV